MEKYLSNQKLLIIGSVAFDDIETPFGKIKKALGGSATYISLAASFFARPSIVAIVGDDFKPHHRKVLENKKIDLSGLQKAKGKTFTWSGKYSFDLNNRTTLNTHLNLFKNFQPHLSTTHQNIPYVFLGNIDPFLQLSVLKQTKNPKLVGCDTMNFWITSKKAQLIQVLRHCDLFVINESEARLFAKEHNLIKCARIILAAMEKKPNRLPPILIVKQGEHGLLMFQKKRILNLPGFLLEDVLDPTGAGDCFAGGLMGYLCREGSRPFPPWDEFKKAAVFGSVTASFCVEEMGTKRLEEINLEDIKNRYQEFKRLTHFEDI